jgi:Tfp pilus assembly protein PilN
MNKHTDSIAQLKEQVKKYHTRNFTLWLSTSAILLLFVLSGISLVTYTTMKNHVLSKDKHASLIEEHKQLVQTWRSARVTSKQLKSALQQLSTITQSCSCTSICHMIARSLPAHTYVTSIMAEHSRIILAGFACDAHELTQFMAQLSKQNYSITRSSSRAEIPGLAFSLTLEPKLTKPLNFKS